MRDSCLLLDGKGIYFLILAVASLALLPVLADNGKLEVTFVDVGQADAILASCLDRNHHLLIDSGDNRYPQSAKNFRSFLTNAFNAFAAKPRRLDIVIALHVPANHIESTKWVLKSFLSVLT